MDMAPTFDTVGWLAATAGVFRRVGPVLLGGGAIPGPVRRLLVADDAFAQADAAVTSVLQDAMRAMAGALPEARPVRIAPGGLDKWREAMRVIQGREIWQVYGRFVEERHPRFGPDIAARMQSAAKITTGEADAARRVHAAARAHIRGQLPPGTVMALPSAPCIAPKIDAPPEAMESYRLRVMRITCVAGHGGVPQVSIPVGTVAGCPVGLSLLGWAGGDEALLDLAGAVAKHCGIVRV
jgi:amidase